MKLPPLPEVNYLGDDVSYGYDACDMHAYGEACAAAERERCATICHNLSESCAGAEECERQIRAL